MTGVGVSRCVSCGGVVERRLEGVFDTRFGIPGWYDIGRCASCGLEQTSPRPSEVELRALYEAHYNFQTVRHARYVKLRARLLSSRLYGLWVWLDGDVAFNSLRGKGRLLDVGCNEGRGLEFFRRNGFDAAGIEFNRTAANIARDKGFAVYESLVEANARGERYDIVVMANVLEHARDPAPMLREVRSVLKEGGELHISCPNSSSWLRSVFGRYWINWHVPFHIVHFSKDTLAAVLKDAGFELVRVRNETPALWVAQSIVASLFARQGNATTKLRDPLWAAALCGASRLLLFPVWWLANRLHRGDCLVVVARMSAQV